MRWVLVVDNDADMRDAMAETLVLDGYGVRVAADGESAIQDLTREELPALVLVDNLMPSMTGLQFLDWLAAHPRFDPVVAVLASGDSRPLRHPRAAALLRKPYGVDDLLELVRKLTART